MFVNNSSLAKIDAQLAGFNPIKVMGMSHMEIRHSKILGWLLDPRENHGLDDKFLKAFLSRAMQGASQPPNSLNIQVRPLSNAIISLEWNNIDVFIEIPHEKNPWCFVIENKVHSKQGKTQLEGYRKFVEQRFPNYSKGFVYLTLNHEEPKDEHYQQIFYADIANILVSVLDESKDRLSSRIYNFINYYLETILELCGMSEEQENIKKLARKLYREHKRALDFIYEHAGGHEFEYGASLFVDNGSRTLSIHNPFTVQGNDYIIADAGGGWFNFVAKDWVNAFNRVNPAQDQAWQGCARWRSLGIPLKAWVEIKDNSQGDKEHFTLVLVAEVGPLEDAQQRLDLVQALDDAAMDYNDIKFSAKSKKLGTQYSRFLNLNKKLKDHFDAKEIADKIRGLLLEFEKRLPAINEGVDEFCRNIELTNIDP